MKALDKSYLLITVHLSVLVTIDLVDLNFFQTRGFKFEKKRYIKTRTSSVSTVSSKTHFVPLFDTSVKCTVLIQLQFYLKYWNSFESSVIL